VLHVTAGSSDTHQPTGVILQVRGEVLSSNGGVRPVYGLEDVIVGLEAAGRHCCSPVRTWLNAWGTRAPAIFAERVFVRRRFSAHCRKERLVDFQGIAWLVARVDKERVAEFHASIEYVVEGATLDAAIRAPDQQSAQSAPVQPTHAGTQQLIATSLPIKRSIKLRRRYGRHVRLYDIRALIQQRGGKLVQYKGDNVAGEAIRLGVLGSYVVWSTDVLAAATSEGWTGCDDKDAAVGWLFKKLHKTGSVSLCPRGPLFLHHSGVPGRPEFIAKMRPVAAVRTALAWKNLTKEERKSHWLGSPVDRKFGQRVRQVPLYQAFPYLLVGGGPWEHNPESFPEAEYEKYGRLGAPGSAWRIIVG
jgi:hypothetical protein